MKLKESVDWDALAELEANHADFEAWWQSLDQQQETDHAE